VEFSISKFLCVLFDRVMTLHLSIIRFLEPLSHTAHPAKPRTASRGSLLIRTRTTIGPQTQTPTFSIHNLLSDLVLTLLPPSLSLSLSLQLCIPLFYSDVHLTLRAEVDSASAMLSKLRLERRIKRRSCTCSFASSSVHVRTCVNIRASVSTREYR